MKMGAGTYYVGDPCYVIRDDDWIPLLESCDYFRDEEFEYNGYHCFAHGTAYGDGEYKDSDGRAGYGVDSGTISIMPIGAVTKDRDRIEQFGHVVEMPKEFSPSYEDGVFYFGDIEIDTN